MSVLLVDDNSIQRKLIRIWLESAGVHSHAIIETEYGSPAADIFLCNQNIIKVILTDVMFNREGKVIKTGADLVAFIREYERNASVELPSYILGFSSDNTTAARMLEAGCDMFLNKPLRRTQLIELVKAHYEFDK